MKWADSQKLTKHKGQVRGYWCKHVCCTRATLRSFLTKPASWLPQEKAGTGLGLDLELCLGWDWVWAKESDGDSGATMLGVTIRHPVCWTQRAAATSLPQAENHKLTKFVSYKATKSNPLPFLQDSFVEQLFAPGNRSDQVPALL